LKNLYEGVDEKNIYLTLIISNSLICYQLSWKWEDYWEEFSDYFSNKKINKDNLLIELAIFIKQSKNNKRFIDTKIKRLDKLTIFINDLILNQEKYYENMLDLRNDLSKIMKQKKDAKTIVFAVKMFSYWARNIFKKINYFPEEINVPIDSRLIALFEKYKWEYEDAWKFYFDLSKKVNIPELHLDAILWVNYDNLIK
jgi:DNA-(apurinic or apyrimidinic site) lyase